MSPERKRLIIVGIRNDLDTNYAFPDVGDDEGLNLKRYYKIRYDWCCIKITDEDFDFSTIPQECILTDLENTENEIPENVHPYLRLKAKS